MKLRKTWRRKAELAASNAVLGNLARINEAAQVGLNGRNELKVLHPWGQIDPDVVVIHSLPYRGEESDHPAIDFAEAMNRNERQAVHEDIPIGAEELRFIYAPR